MVQAAAEGVIDFSQTKFENRQWEIRLYRILRYLELKNEREQLVLQLHERLSHVPRHLAVDTRQSLMELIEQTQKSIEYTYTPNAKRELDVDKATAKAQDAKGTWETEYDMSLDDPEVQRRLDEVVANLNALRNNTQREAETY